MSKRAGLDCLGMAPRRGLVATIKTLGDRAQEKACVWWYLDSAAGDPAQACGLEKAGGFKRVGEAVGGSAHFAAEPVHVHFHLAHQRLDGAGAQAVILSQRDTTLDR